MKKPERTMADYEEFYMNILIQKLFISFATSLIFISITGWSIVNWQWWGIYLPFNVMLLTLLYL